MHRYTISLLLFACAVLVTPRAIAQEPLHRAELERLVRVFGAIEMFQARAISYLRVAKRPPNHDTAKTYTFMERVVAAKQEELLPAFVKAFSIVSSEEATQIAEALETPMGRKLIRMSIDVHLTYSGDIMAARDANPLSPEERVQFNELGATAGWRIYERLSKDPSFPERIAQAVLSLPMFLDLQ